jgi:hypothetical protein
LHYHFAQLFMQDAGILVQAAADNGMAVLVHCRVSFSSFVAALV